MTKPMIWNAARERKERKSGVSYSEHITVPTKKRYREISAYLRYVRIRFRPVIKSALLQRCVTSVPGYVAVAAAVAIARLLRHIPACRDQPCPTASSGNPAEPVTSQNPVPPPPVRKVGSTWGSQL